LSDVFDPVEYRRSKKYKQLNYRFGLLSGTFSLLLTLGFLWFGGFEWVDRLSRSIGGGPISVALIFLSLIGLGSGILNLPSSYYRTFVIDQDYGFNSTDPALFFMDLLNGALLALLLGGGLLTLLILFHQRTGPNFWLYAWGLIAGFILLVNLFHSRLI